MPSLLTDHYHSCLAASFLTKLQWTEELDVLLANGELTSNAYNKVLAVGNTTTLYMFIGTPEEWVDTSNATVSDNHPPIPVDTPQEVDYACWRDMLVSKRISAANTNFVIPRIDWVANTVYVQYDDRAEGLSNSAFYVLDTTTSPYRVYKCLWNNEGALSTISPSASIFSNVAPMQTSDGYTWQYMYTIISVNDRFLTSDWMPVYTDVDVQTAAFEGAGTLPLAVPLLIENAGFNYNVAALVTTTINGDGVGATVAPAGVQITGGTITLMMLSDGGVGYSEVTSVNVYQSGASVATVRALIPPYPNHGYDPVHELYAKNLMVVGSFYDVEGGKLTVNNDYRRIGLVMNPLLANGAPATNTFYEQTFNIWLTSNTGVFVSDDGVSDITNDNAPRAFVVDVVQDANNNYVVRTTSMTPDGVAAPFAPGNTIKCLLSGVEGVIANTAGPTLLPYSGHVVYFTQRTPITRGAGQIENIKVIFPFG